MPLCPFYGKHAVPLVQMMVPQGGNQCALITTSYSPCRVELAGGVPDLDNCELKGTKAAVEFSAFRVSRRVAGRPA